MKTVPVYFPMTYLSAAAESRLSACFGQIAVYRPSNRTLPETMQTAMDADRLVVATPVVAESDRLIALMDAYYTWAAENKGVDLAVFKGGESHIPFYGDTSISGIRQNIRDMGGESEKEEMGGPVFKARLFLEMAQELDRQNSALEQSLDDVRMKEDSMLADLQGDAVDPGGIEKAFQSGRIADPGAYMTAARLQAWWQLVREGPASGNLLITDSRAVIEHLMEVEPGLKKTDLSLRLPRHRSGTQVPAAWQDRLLEYLVRLTSKATVGAVPADMPAAEAVEAAVNLSFYRLENMDTEAFFNHLEAPAGTLAAPGAAESLVICLVADVEAEPK